MPRSEIPAAYTPTEEQVASVLEWFDRYDALAATADLEAMADLAMFPLNSVTDDGAGNGSASMDDRRSYLAQMAEVMTEGVTMESRRTPHFLSDALVFVVTDARFTHEGVTRHLRYGDLLVRHDGDWRFQTMVQGGWGAAAS